MTGVKVGIITELSGDGWQQGVMNRFDESVELLVKAGAEVVEVSCPSFVHALAAYYLILPAEASSNLAKFDAMRFGLRVTPEGSPVGARTSCAPPATPASATRSSAGSSWAPTPSPAATTTPTTARRRRSARSSAATSTPPSSGSTSSSPPTAPTTAFRLGEKLDDPMAMYLNDLATIPANLAGVPGISVPNGLADEDSLPTGFQVLAPALADDRVYRVGAALEALHVRRSGAVRCSTARPDSTRRTELT